MTLCASSGVSFTGDPKRYPTTFCAYCQQTVPVTASGTYADHPADDEAPQVALYCRQTDQDVPDWEETRP